jgi:hypothetical protein
MAAIRIKSHIRKETKAPRVISFEMRRS